MSDSLTISLVDSDELFRGSLICNLADDVHPALEGSRGIDVEGFPTGSVEAGVGYEEPNGARTIVLKFGEYLDIASSRRA
jgi:hypothetical protein